MQPLRGNSWTDVVIVDVVQAGNLKSMKARVTDALLPGRDHMHTAPSYHTSKMSEGEGSGDYMRWHEMKLAQNPAIHCGNRGTLTLTLTLCNPNDARPDMTKRQRGHQ